MTSTRRVNMVAGAVLLLSMAGGVVALNTIDQMHHRAAMQDALYLRSSRVLRRLSLGYTGLLADIYWTRTVQYFGEQHHSRSGDFRLLAPLLQITTELDPRLLPAYQFGATFLSPPPPNGPGLPQSALSLMQFGIEHNPDQWRLYYNLGFLYYTEFKDYPRAADAFARGAKLPVTSPYMPILAARMAQHAGELDTARMLWFTTYQSTKEASVREIAAQHLLALQIDEEVTRLEQAIEKYRQSGRSPASMADLERAGLVHGIPADPTGHPYKLMPDGRIEVQNPENFRFITKGLPKSAARTQSPQSPESASK